MKNKVESLLDQKIIEDILYEFYKKGNEEDNLLIAKKVIQEMIEKLQPFFRDNTFSPF